MESNRQNLPSKNSKPFKSSKPSRSSRHLSVDEAGRFSEREPLSESTGNAQLHTVASESHYHEDEGFHQPVGRPLYPGATPPSRSRQRSPNSLETRRQHIRRQRYTRHGQHPIADLPQYQAYRDRQESKSAGKKQEAKWPDVLEDAFLEALTTVPNMGRAKFAIDGKPHGRNQMISLWLWIAYLQSLAPGEHPDENMRRGRKEVMSHIQVLKGFFAKNDPALERLFPPRIAENYQENPILIGLSRGRLPSNNDGSEAYSQRTSSARSHMMPATFWLLVASSRIPNDSRGQSPSEEALYSSGALAHRYTGLAGSRQRQTIEFLPSWWQRFPAIARNQNIEEQDYEIIHMHASLKLMPGRPAGGTQLLTKMEMVLPGRGMQPGQWQTTISLSKPAELCDPANDPPLEAETFAVPVLSSNDTETRIKVAFPVRSWMHTFTRLAKIQEEVVSGAYNPTGNSPSPGDLLEQISMYQEVHCSLGPDQNPVRQAIILWTFCEAGSGAEGSTVWRYLELNPPRRRVMSLSPYQSHTAVAGMQENLHPWEGNQDSPMHGIPGSGLVYPSSIHSQGDVSTVSPYMTSSTQSIVSSPQPEIQGHPGSVMHSPFLGHDFNTYQNPYFNLPPHQSNSMTFASALHTPLTTHDPNVPMLGDFLSSANVGVHLGGTFDPAAGDLFQDWHMSQQEGFGVDPAWMGFGLQGENSVGAGWIGEHGIGAGLVSQNAVASGMWADARQGWVLEQDSTGESGRGMEWLHGNAGVAVDEKGGDDDDDECGSRSGSSSGNSPKEQLEAYEAGQTTIYIEREMGRLQRNTGHGRTEYQQQARGDNSDGSSMGTGRATVSPGSGAARTPLIGFEESAVHDGELD